MKTTALRVCVALAVGLGAASSVHAQTTALYLESEAGDSVGRGQTRTYTVADLTFTGTIAADRTRVDVQARKVDFSTYWYIALGSRGTTPLAPGVYENAVRTPFRGPAAGVEVTGNSVGCNTIVGRFVVYELTVTPSGALASLAADFEQHCDGQTPALYGAIRFNASRSTLNPFDGVRGVYSLHLDTAANGYVTGPGIDCGAGQADCDESYAPNTQIVLQATALPGYAFVGWAGGDCLGDAAVALTIRRRHFCLPVFSAAPPGSGVENPDYSQGALVLDGPLAYNGGSPPRTRYVFAALPETSPIGSTFSVFASTQSVQIHAAGPINSRFGIEMAAPPGVLLMPGTYEYTASDTLAPNPRLVSLGCSGGVGGRFTIHEIVFSAGVLTRFSADFELPCGSLGRQTGSVRYHSTRASLLPFDGDYPRTSLRIVPTIGGSVSAPGISCGDGGLADCDESYAASTNVTLLAVPSAGYQFVGWAGQCSDGVAVTSVTVDSLVRCFAVFTPAAGSAQPADPSLGVSTLYVDAPGTEFPPRARVWTTATSVVSISTSSGYANITFRSVGGGASVSFTSGRGPLTAGDYEEARGSSSGGRPAMSVPNCNVTSGRFRVYHVSADGSGNLLSFGADFEAQCSGLTTPYVVGAVRFNSSRASILPFDGVFPLIKLSVDPAANGVVTAAGIDCGPGRPDCSEIYGTSSSVVVQATPNVGYRFVAWSGACSGGARTTISVNWMRRCGAIFGSAIPGFLPEDPRLKTNAFMIDSAAGEPLGGGQRHVWLDAWTGSIYGRQTLNATPSTPDSSGSWWVYLRAPGSSNLTTGIYANAVYAFSGNTSLPGLYISSPLTSCSSSLTGRFIIYELAYESLTSTTVSSLAMDFEVRCTPSSPPLRGSIRFNSNRGIVEPFAGEARVPATGPTDFTGDGWPDLLWRESSTGHIAIWQMVGSNAALTTFLLPAGAERVADLDWEIRGAGDFNGDGRPDIIWQNKSNGQIAVWYLSGYTRIGTSYIFAADGTTFVEPDLNWKIVAAGDLDRDGYTDLLWRHRTTGANRVWHMKGNVQWDSVALPTVADPLWEIAGLGDMNGDGWLDLVWRNYGQGDLATWSLYDTLVQGTLFLTPNRNPDTDWRIVGIGDLNGDGAPDLIWQHVTNGQLGVWFFKDLGLIGGGYLNPWTVGSSPWRIVGVR